MQAPVGLLGDGHPDVLHRWTARDLRVDARSGAVGVHSRAGPAIVSDGVEPGRLFVVPANEPAWSIGASGKLGLQLEEASINLASNPGVETDTAGLVGAQGGDSVARVAGSILGNWVARVTTTNVLGSGMVMQDPSGAGIVVLPSAQYAWSVIVDSASAAGRQLRAQIDWYTAANAFISSTTGTVVTLSGGRQRLLVSGVSPGTAGKAKGLVVTASAQGVFTFDCDALQFEEHRVPSSPMPGASRAAASLYWLSTQVPVESTYYLALTPIDLAGHDASRILTIGDSSAAAGWDLALYGYSGSIIAELSRRSPLTQYTASVPIALPSDGLPRLVEMALQLRADGAVRLLVSIDGGAPLDSGWSATAPGVLPAAWNLGRITLGATPTGQRFNGLYHACSWLRGLRDLDACRAFC